MNKFNLFISIHCVFWRHSICAFALLKSKFAFRLYAAISIAITLNACSEDPQIVTNRCPTLANYSPDFIASDFYQGWRILTEKGITQANCAKAAPYFISGVNTSALYELSALYLDYCTPEHRSWVEKSSIYHSQYMLNSIDIEELKWVVDLAQCNSPVEQYALGNMLINGFVAVQNTEQGLHFLALAAKQNHMLAQQSLVQALDEIGEKEVASLWRAKLQQQQTQYPLPTFD